MEAILGLSLPLHHSQKSGVGVKRGKAKTGVTSHLSVPEYGMTNASNCNCGITPDSNPKMGNKTYIFFKAPRLNSMSYRTLGFLKYGMTNAIDYKCGFARDFCYSFDSFWEYCQG